MVSDSTGLAGRLGQDTWAAAGAAARLPRDLLRLAQGIPALSERFTAGQPVTTSPADRYAGGCWAEHLAIRPATPDGEQASWAGPVTDGLYTRRPST